MLRTTTIAVLAVGLCAVPTASAQYGGRQQIQPTTNAGWGDLGFFSASQAAFVRGMPVADASSTVVSMLIEGYFGVGTLEVAFAAGLAHGSWDVDSPVGSTGDSALRLGNPFAGLFYRHDTRETTIRIGGGIALPVADIDDGASASEQAAQGIALDGAMAIFGMWDAWLWEPNRFTIAAPVFRIDSRHPQFVWAAEAGLGVMIHTGDGDADTEVPFQIAVEGGARLSPAFVIGGRFQAWFLTTGEEDEDKAQLAMEPFIRVEGENGFGYARLTMNLDEPLGFAFDDDGVWGLHFGGGARF